MTSLAIECGGSHSVAVLESEPTKKYTFGPGNYKFIQRDPNPNKLEEFLRAIKSKVNGNVRRVAIGMAGLATLEDKNIVRELVNKVWDNLEEIWTGGDSEISLSCLDDYTDVNVRMIIISGTGSVCYGTNVDTKEVIKIGGHGKILGSHGSAYFIGHKGLRKAVTEFEYKGESELLERIYARLGLGKLSELTDWTLSASPDSIASICELITQDFEARKGNEISDHIVQSALRNIVADASALVRKLGGSSYTEPIKVKIGLTGSVLTKNVRFSQELREMLEAELGPSVKITFAILEETVHGAFRKLQNVWEGKGDFTRMRSVRMSEEELRKLVLPIKTQLSLTEERNPKSFKLDTMSIPEGVDLMLNEESNIHAKIAEHKETIEILVKKITNAYRNSGRLIYVGAGTSGRLGILDASECPPTFKAPPNWVQGIIAGGKPAVFKSVEGAEDYVSKGVEAVEEMNLCSNDVVIGIAASGTTPFVWGALYGAKCAGATTALLYFNPYLEMKLTLDHLICVSAGPEILTGSTRLKAGSGTKLVLNILTTLSMVQYGKCLENLMVDLNPVNAKLKDRAQRIVFTILDGKVDIETVRAVVEQNDFDIRKSVDILREKFPSLNHF